MCRKYKDYLNITILQNKEKKNVGKSEGKQNVNQYYSTSPFSKILFFVSLFLNLNWESNTETFLFYSKFIDCVQL